LRRDDKPARRVLSRQRTTSDWHIRDTKGYAQNPAAWQTGFETKPARYTLSEQDGVLYKLFGDAGKDTVDRDPADTLKHCG
jgi:hypothetical protein